jgi:hypothetical protein
MTVMSANLVGFRWYYHCLRESAGLQRNPSSIHMEFMFDYDVPVWRLGEILAVDIGRNSGTQRTAWARHFDALNSEPRVVECRFRRAHTRIGTQK